MDNTEQTYTRDQPGKQILALITDGYGAPGGIAQYNQDLLTSVADMAAVAGITVLSMNGAPSVPHPVIRQLPARRSKVLYALKSLFLVRRERPDYIFCGHLNLLPLAGMLARFFQLPLWLQIHGIDAWDKPSPRIAGHVEHVALVTSVSRYTRQKFLQWANLDPARVKVLPNTVSDIFRPVDKSRAIKKIGLGQEKIILTVGRLAASEQYKGHDDVIACLPDLIQQYPDIMYLVAGTGDDEARLVNMAERLGVREHLKFLGNVGHGELPHLYSAADLFVMPSTGEGFGIVFLEAMASGTPALGLNMAGSVDALQDGQLGLLSSREDICSTILQALKSGRQEGLSTRVHATFGRDNFNRHVQRLLSTCLFKTDQNDRTAKLRLSCAG